jgi:tetratricopeptide (TPR) repeat protein
MGDSSQARQNAKKADLDKANQNATWALQLLGEFKSLPRALQYISEAIAIRPKASAKWYTTRAQIYRALGRNQLAFYDYNAALRVDPRSYYNYVGRALCLRKLRRYGEALADLEAALEADPSSAAFRFFRGTVYHHMEEYGAAIDDYSGAIATPNSGPGFSARSRLLRAACYEKLGRLGETISDLTVLARPDSSSPAGFTSLGIVLLESGRPLEAVEAFTGAVERAGASPALYARSLDNRAWALILTGQLEAAGDDLGAALAGAGEWDPAPPFHRGVAALAAGAHLKALPELLRACELVEGATRREARRAGGGEEDGSPRADGGLDSSASGAGRSGSGNHGAPRGRHGGSPSVAVPLLAPELAGLLGEGMPPGMEAPRPGSAGGTGGGVSPPTLPGDDETDSDSFSDAVRERDTALLEPVRRRGGAAAAEASAAGPTSPLASPTRGGGTPSAGATRGEGGGGGDGGSDAGSVPSGSVAQSATGAGRSQGFGKRQPVARNAGRSSSRGASRGGPAAAAAREKPWATVPGWARERPWPEAPPPFTCPRTRSAAMAAARVQTYTGLVYAGLGHAERALHHFMTALSAWPAYVPARFQAGLCLLALGRPAAAESELSAVLKETEGVAAEVLVVPPTWEGSAGGEGGSRAGSRGRGRESKPSGTYGFVPTSRAAAVGAGDGATLWAHASSRAAMYRLGIASLELLPVVATAESTHAPTAAEAAPGPPGGPAMTAAPPVVITSSIGQGMEAAAAAHSRSHAAAAARARASVLLGRARARQAQALHADAAVDFDGALAAPGALDRASALLSRAATQLALRRIPAALADCEAAVAAGCVAPAVSDLAGQAQAYCGQYHEAVVSFSGAIRVLQGLAEGSTPPATPVLVDVLSRRAEAYRCQGNANSAILDLNSALMSGAVGALLEQRGHCHTDNEDAEAALADYTAALALSSSAFGTARLHYASGIVHAGGDVWAPAVASFTAALNSLEPIAGITSSVGRTAKVVSSGEDGDDEGEGHGSHHHHSPRMLVSLAIAALRTVMPHSGEGVGAALRELGNAPTHPGAALLARSGVVASGLKAWASTAKAEGKDGREGAAGRAALALQRHALRVAAVNAAAPEAAVRMRIAATHERAKALQHLGAHREAARDFTEVLVSQPGNPHALLRRGFSFAALGEWAAAAEDMETARSLRPGDVRFEWNYAGLRGVEGVMLAGPGEEPQWPVLGLEDVRPAAGEEAVGEAAAVEALRTAPKRPLHILAPNATGLLHPLTQAAPKSSSAEPSSRQVSAGGRALAVMSKRSK